MTRIALNAVVLVAAGCAALPLRAQDMNMKKEPKPALSSSGSLLEEWNDLSRRIIAIAEDMPEDKFDFKPKPEMRSWASQVSHIAEGNYYFINPVAGKPLPKEAPETPIKTRAELVAKV